MVNGESVLPQSRISGLSGPNVMAWPMSASAEITGRRNRGFAVSAIDFSDSSQNQGRCCYGAWARLSNGAAVCFDFADLRPYQYRPFRTGPPERTNPSASKV